MNDNESDLLLFVGDSITDAGRNEYHRANLGQGYVSMISGQLLNSQVKQGLKIVNRGVGGNTLEDLNGRWEKDCLALNPDIVSILIGINDIGTRFKNELPFDVNNTLKFKNLYQKMIDKLKFQNSRIILMEPFLLPSELKREQWVEYVEMMQNVIRELASQNNLTFIPLQEILYNTGEKIGFEKITGTDGVHPTNLGHALIANQWLRYANVI